MNINGEELKIDSETKLFVGKVVGLTFLGTFAGIILIGTVLRAIASFG